MAIVRWCGKWVEELESPEDSPERPGPRRVAAYFACNAQGPGHPLGVRMAGQTKDGLFRTAVQNGVTCPVCGRGMEGIRPDEMPQVRLT